MTRDEKSLFIIIRPLLDIVVILLAWFLAYFIRFESVIPLPWISSGQPGLFGIFFTLVWPLTAITIYNFYRKGLYSSLRFQPAWIETRLILQTNTFSFLFFVILIYFLGKEKISRVALLNYWVFSNFLFIGIHWMVRCYWRYLHRKGLQLIRVLLIGNGPQLTDYVQTVQRYKDAGIEFVGWKDGPSDFQNRMDSKQINIPKLDMPLEDINRLYAPEVWVIGYQGADSSRVNEILQKHYNDLISIQVLPDMSYAFIGHQIQDFNGIPVITVNWPKLSAWDYFIKRIFDFIFSLIGLIILSPVLLLLAILVKATSRGPIFYGQERVGLDGQSFTMWKFRSMRIDAEKETGAVWCVQGDSRRTAFGSFLRATSLDELPQLWNVFRGEMSLVGPRPERPIFVEKFKDQIPSYMLRHRMKAGITGWAQINGWRGNTSLEKRIECDIKYIKDWSLWLDIKIIFLTFWRGFINKNAY